MIAVLKWGFFLVLLFFMAALPSLVPFYLIFVATKILMIGLLAVSFNLLFGYTGLLSFGHAAFFGIGAYSVALLLKHFALPLGLVLVAGPVCSGLAAAIIGALSVKRDEVYFALITLAFGMMVFTVAHEWRSLTNGSDGVAGFPLTELLPGLDLNLAHPVHYYYFTLVVVGLALYILWRITRSHFGLVLKGLRENTERIAFTGINVFTYRLLSFILSGIFAGLAGSLYAPFQRIATPDMLHWSQSAEPVLVSVIGGSQAFAGPLLGTLVFEGLQAIITSYTDQWMIYLGLVLLVMVILLPKGLVGGIKQVINRWG